MVSLSFKIQGIWVITFILLCLAVFVMSLTPLTQIQPSPAELAVFPETLRQALLKLGSPKNAVVHILGASSVEDAVDWSSLCLDGG